MTSLPHLSSHGSLAAYLAAIGLMVILERDCPLATACWSWRTGALEIDGLDLAELEERLMAVARQKTWRSPEKVTKHPVFGNAGRRSLCRGATEAREWLAKMPRADALANLRLLVTDQHYNAGIIHLPKKEAARRGGFWNLGSVHPTVLEVAGSPGNAETAWLAALAWEASLWISAPWEPAENRRDAPYWQGDRSGLGAWIAPIWFAPIEVRRAAIWFRGRGRHTPRTWSRWVWSQYSDHPDIEWRAWHMTQHLSPKTWEFVGRKPGPFLRRKWMLEANV